MERTCLKCRHVNAQATGQEMEACPRCGAIYSRVQAAVAAQATVRAQASVSRQPQAAPFSGGAFLDDLRRHSNYPAFRTVVGVCAILGYVLAALIALGAAMSLFKGGVAMGLGGLVFAVVAAIGARVGKEVSLMVADASDALVRMAARREHRA